jgi:hypothetical protein
VHCAVCGACTGIHTHTLGAWTLPARCLGVACALLARRLRVACASPACRLRMYIPVGILSSEGLQICSCTTFLLIRRTTEQHAWCGAG